MLEDDQALPPLDRSALHHAYVIANGKGGVGKTTLATNFAGLVAADIARTAPDTPGVLLIDVNGQGNCGRDLGYRGQPIDDEGLTLRNALRDDVPLTPVRRIRPCLDVVIGGRHVADLPDHLSATYRLNPRRQVLSLAYSLAPIASRYDMIVIDSAPENPPLQQLALAAARKMVAPTRSDKASISDGLGSISRQFQLVRKEVNPTLIFLGVAIYGSISTATSIHRRARQYIAEELGGNNSYTFDTIIRYSEAVGQDARLHGKLIHELEIEASKNPKFWEIRAGKVPADKSVSKTSSSVAEDVASLAREILIRANTLDTP